MRDTGATSRGFKYYLLITLGRKKKVNKYEPKTKDEATAIIDTHFKDLWVPEKVVADGASKLVRKEWKKVLRTFSVKKETT